MNNFKKIKSMNEKELAEWLDRISNQDRDDCIDIGCYRCMYNKTHHYPIDCGDCEWKYGIFNWLKLKCK